jgi:hypothetical protein
MTDLTNLQGVFEAALATFSAGLSSYCSWMALANLEMLAESGQFGKFEREAVARIAEEYVSRRDVTWRDVTWRDVCFEWSALCTHFATYHAHAFVSWHI